MEKGFSPATTVLLSKINHRTTEQKKTNPLVSMVLWSISKTEEQECCVERKFKTSIGHMI